MASVDAVLNSPDEPLPEVSAVSLGVVEHADINPNNNNDYKNL